MATPTWFSELLPSLSSLQVDQLYQHYQLLERWNQRMNLTTVAGGTEAVRRHYCESVFFIENLPDESDRLSICDVGSGAGFPGVPIAVLRPAWIVSLVESNRKKAVFLRESTRGIANVQVIPARAESLTEKFDWIVSRAVDPDEVIALTPTLGRKIGLMIGEEDFSRLKVDSDVAWRQPVRLPWGEHRLCIYGTIVPRETI